MLRAAHVVAVLALASSGAAGAARQQASLALLTPANGVTVVQSGELGTAPAFGWRIDWGSAPAGGPVVIVLRIASDPELTQNAAENMFTCAARDVGCRTTFRPNRIYQGRYFWRVMISGAVRATSETWSFTGLRQDAGARPDLTRPQVRALAGEAKRGQTAYFAARVGDDRGVARLRAALLRRGREVARAVGPFRPVTWRLRQTLYSNRPLPRRLAAGAYQLCFTAWDRAGNRARSCVAYRLR